MADDRSEEEKAAAAAAEAYTDAADALRQWHKLMREGAPLAAARIGTHDELQEKLRDTTAAQSKANEAFQLAQEQGRAVAEGLGALIGLNKSYETSMLGSVAAVLKGGEAQKKLQNQLKKTFSLQNIGYSLLLKIQQATTGLMMKQDKALVSFNKQTGAARIYGNELLALESKMFTHGVTMDDAAEAFGALTRSVYGLKGMSRSTRTDLVDTTAILQELGVSADTTGANVQFMTRSLGMSVRESAKYQRELFTLAQQIGMPPAEMAEGFKSAQPKLAAFGKDAGRIFKKLATAARASGMEIQQMLSLVEQFDTFEGAATAVGKLNALLGGPFLNSMEMVMQTDPTERMRMLSGALNDAGKSFDQMTYYEKKSIAAAAGLSDVSELALIMAGNFNGVAGGAQKSQAEIQRLAAQTAEMNEIWEELTQIVRMFAFEMRPVITRVREWIQNIQDLKDTVKKWLPVLGAFSLALVVVGSVMAATAISAAGMWGAIFAPIAAVAALTVVFTKIYEWTGSLEYAMYGLALGAGAVALAFGAFTVSAWGVAASITAVIGGITWLMKKLFFTNIGHSNMLEGLEQVGGAFGNMGHAIAGARKESDALNRSFKATSRNTSTALSDANSAATTTSPTYLQLKNRVLMGSKSGATSSSPREIEVKISLDSMFKRYFTADVLETVGGRKSPLNTVTEGNA